MFSYIHSDNNQRLLNFDSGYFQRQRKRDDSLMQKWEYAHAVYENGLLDSYIGEGLADITVRDLGPFLEEAGQKGWELCGVLPYPSIREPNSTLAVIFKRPDD